LKLKQLSLQHITVRIFQIVKRFPLAMLVCVIGTITGIVAIHADEPGILPNILLTLSLAAPIFVSTVLILGAKKLSVPQQWVMNTAFLVLLGVYYVLLPDPSEADTMLYMRHIMWALGFVLLVTFIPFVSKKGKESILAFWQYNRALLFALVLTWIWVGALQAGISIALMSIDFLFELNIDGERYAELWVVLVGTFAPLFFLNRLPKKPQQHDTALAYPKEVRLFSQFVLVPLVSVYFLILYAYTIRILMLSEWPEGQLAYMILGFSFLGVLTYLALYPLRSTVNWIKIAGTVLFAAMIPQVGMLFWALWFRISQYGITENRYFVFIFGCWLVAMSVYFLVSKWKDIRIIPVTIFLIAFLTSFGPWGAFSVSERSQIHRLEGLLVENGILVDGTIQKLSTPQVTGDSEQISKEDQKEINATVRYLYQVHGLDGIQAWFSEDLDQIDGDKRGYQGVPRVVVEELMGIQYLDPWESSRYEQVLVEEGDTFFLLSDDRGGAFDVSGYDVFVESYTWQVFMIDEVEYRAAVSEDGMGFEIFREETLLINHSLQEFMGSLEGVEYTRSVSPSEMSVMFENDLVRGLLYIEHLRGERDEEGNYVIEEMTGRLLISFVE